MLEVIIALATVGFLASDNLVRKVMCASLMESAIILTFLHVGHMPEARAPILDPNLRPPAQPMADPLPQALMLTAIVIGVCFNALILAFIARVKREHGTLNASMLHD